MNWNEITEPRRVDVRCAGEKALAPSMPLTEQERQALANVSVSLLSALEAGQLERLQDYTGNYFVRPSGTR